MVNDESGDRLEQLVNTIKTEAQQKGTLTSNSAVSSTLEALDMISENAVSARGTQSSKNNIIPAYSMQTVLTPVFANVFGANHDDKYAREAVHLADQFSAKPYWKEIAENNAMTHYLQGDFGITDDEAPNKETSMIRRGLDAIFVAGVLRPCMDKDHMFPALGQPYFKEVGEQSLPLAASVYEGAQSQMYMNMARNFNEVTDTLAQAGHHSFNEPA